jgi:hypothetical protein
MTETSSTAPIMKITKGSILTPPVIGRITAGHTELRNGKALPVKDDHFTLTSLVQDKDSRVWEAHPLQKTLVKGKEKLLSIPVRIAFNDPNLSLQNSFTAFDPQTGGVLCSGNGVTAKRIVENKELNEREIKEMACPRPEGCEYGVKTRCKNFSRAYFRVEGQEDELGTFIFRTTSFNSLDRLGSRLSQLYGLTNGKIAGMPMSLELRTKTTTKSFRLPVYFADLVTRPGMKLIEAISEARSYQDGLVSNGLNLEGLEDALRAGLNNSAFAEEIEDAAEWGLSDEGLFDAAAETINAGETGSTHGIKGLDAIVAEKLAARAMEKAASDPVLDAPVSENSADVSETDLDTVPLLP